MDEVEENNGLLAIGGKFGAYDVLKLLGSGGMGEVYLLRSTVNGEFYAGKIMFPAGSGGDREESEWRRRFANEALFAMKVTHKNLIRVHDAGEDPATHLCFIIMDYMAGGTLSSRIRAKGRMEVGEAVKIAIKVATALEVAHRAGIVHRDIKPDNIMFDDDGQPHLADLGIAKFTTGDKGTTNTKMIIGTPSYMAPEQMMDSHKVDARADVYSLGIVLYEMLTGACPHESTSVMELLSKVVKGEELPNVCKIREDVPSDVGYVLSRMTANKASRRPASALEAARMLYAAYKGRLKASHRIRGAVAGAVSRFQETGAVAKAAAFLAVSLAAVVAALVFANVRGARRGGLRGGGRGYSADFDVVKTNEVDMVRYKVIASTNKVSVVSSDADSSAYEEDDWDPNYDDEYIPKTEEGAIGVSVASSAAGGGDSPSSVVAIGETSKAEGIRIVVDNRGNRPSEVRQIGSSALGASVVGGVRAVGSGEGVGAQGAQTSANPLADDDPLFKPDTWEQDGEASRGESQPQDDDNTPTNTFNPNIISEVKLSSVPKNFQDDIKRRQNEYLSRSLEWGWKGCIVYGRVELDRTDILDGIATWAWLNLGGTFTAAMHPETSGGNLVFLRHGYERLSVNVPQASERWRDDTVCSLGTLTLRKLPDDQTGRISFRLSLPKKVKEASVKVQLAGDYPVGFGRTRRPFMAVTVAEQKMASDERFELSGCARDRYVLTIDAPYCRLYKKALVLDGDAAHRETDTVVAGGIIDLDEVRMRYPKSATFTVQEYNGLKARKYSVDNRGNIDLLEPFTACLRSVEDDEGALRLLSEDYELEIYDCVKFMPSRFQAEGLSYMPNNAVEITDGIIRPGHVYCCGIKNIPSSQVFFSFDSY